MISKTPNLLKWRHYSDEIEMYVGLYSVQTVYAALRCVLIDRNALNYWATGLLNWDEMKDTCYGFYFISFYFCRFVRTFTCPLQKKRFRIDNYRTHCAYTHRDGQAEFKPCGCLIRKIKGKQVQQYFVVSNSTRGCKFCDWCDSRNEWVIELLIIYAMAVALFTSYLFGNNESLSQHASDTTTRILACC